MDWTGSPPFGRRESLTNALEELERRRDGGEQLIVEIGTSERYEPSALGNAMLAFGWYALQHPARIESVDIRPGAVLHSREILEKYLPQALPLVTYTVADAYDWVPTIKGPIDFCYMDFTYEIHCDPEYGGYARRNNVPSNYVEIYERFPPWKPGALLLIDDCSPETLEVKGVKLVPHMLEKGWKREPGASNPSYPQVLLSKL